MPEKKTTKQKKAVATESRKLKTPTYRSFRLQKRIASPMKKLPGSFFLLKQTLRALTANWKLFLGIIIIYGVLNLLLVQGFLGVDLSEAKASLESTLAGNWGKIVGGFSLFTYLAGSAGSISSEAASAYRLILMLIASLALIWSLRHISSGQKIRIRDSFYNGMYPLVPFILVFLVIMLQIVPFTVVAYMYTVVGATSGLEILLWGSVLLMLAVLTFYMLCSSIFALYIACLPGMQPVAALRSARQLVRYRRWAVTYRILFLPTVLFLASAVVLIPIILFITPAAVWVFFVMLMFMLPITHGYMYRLYRELLHEK